MKRIKENVFELSEEDHINLAKAMLTDPELREMIDNLNSAWKKATTGHFELDVIEEDIKEDYNEKP